MASLLLAGGAPGMRHSLPHARIMIHQPSGQAVVSTITTKLYSSIIFVIIFSTVKNNLNSATYPGPSNGHSPSGRRNNEAKEIN